MSSSYNNPAAKKGVSRGADAIAAISGTRLSSSDNLPMLNVIAERFALLLPISARQASLPIMETGEHFVQTLRYGMAVDSIKQPSLVAVTVVPELGSQILVALEGSLARVLIHSLLGGRPHTVELARKTFTHIDRKISVKLMERVLLALADTFSPIAKITPRIETVDAQAQFTTVMPREAPATTMRVEISCEGETGELTVVIPRSALDPIRENLSRAVIEGSAVENHWVTDIKESASELPLKIDAVLSRLELPLREIMDWRVGTSIELPPVGNNSTRLVSGESTVALGKTGRWQGRMGVLVTDVKALAAVAPLEENKEPQA